MEVVLDADERTQEGMVQRIVALGFEIRVEFVLADGTEIWAQLTRPELQRLELEEGQIAYLRPAQAKSFNGSSPSETTGASTPHGSPDEGDAEKPAAV
jgi:molybdopterin-binding protein